MSVEATSWALKLPDLDPAAKLILVVLGDASNPDSEFTCWLKHQTIADRVGISRSTVQRRLADLEEAGLLTIEERRRKGGGQSANLYRLPLHQIDAAGASPGEAAGASPGEAAISETEVEPEEETETSSSLNDVEAQTPVVIRHVFDHWAGLYSPRAAFDDKRAKRIQARLKERMSTGSTLDEAGRDLCLAISNARRDDWLAGRAAKSPGYLNKLDTLLRDAAQVERLLALTEPGPVPDDDFDPDEEHLRDLRALHGDDYVPAVDDDEPDAAPAAA